MVKERTVIHVSYLADGSHHYFGSLAGIFELFTVEQLGISYGSLRNYGLTEDRPYHNDKCVIRKGRLLSKHGNRGKKT